MTEEGKYRITLQEDREGNVVIPFPEEMLEELDWSEGDVLEFISDEYSDAFYIRKVD